MAETRKEARATAGNLARSLGDKIDVTVVQFDARELLTVKEQAWAVVDLRGAHSTWIDYAQNRVYLGHDPDLTAEEVKNLADTVQARGAQGLALVLVPMERATARVNVGTSIRSQRQPLAAGSQFQFRRKLPHLSDSH